MSAMNDAGKVYTVSAVPLLHLITKMRDLGRTARDAGGTLIGFENEFFDVAKKCHIALSWFERDQADDFEEAQVLLDLIYDFKPED